MVETTSNKSKDIEDIKNFINFRIKECSESIPDEESLFFQSAFLSMSYAVMAYKDILIFIDSQNQQNDTK